MFNNLKFGLIISSSAFIVASDTWATNLLSFKIFWQGLSNQSWRYDYPLFIWLQMIACVYLWINLTTQQNKNRPKKKQIEAVVQGCCRGQEFWKLSQNQKENNH